MLFKKDKDTEKKGYVYRPREFDRDEKIAIQKIVSTIPVTRKLLSQELLVTAINNYVVRNIKVGSTAAHNVNTTKYPHIFFKSLNDLIESSENLKKIEPYWRFEGTTPTEQLQDLTERRDKIIKGFIYDSFETLLKELETKKSSSAKQRLFDEYQAGITNNIEACGEENFEYFKELCRKNLNIQE